MNFDFDADQLALRVQLRDYFQRRCDLRTVRRATEGDAAARAAVFAGLAELGLGAISIAPEQDGLGLGVLEICIAAEEVGRALAPTSIVTSAGPATWALQRYASAATQERLLPQLAAGVLQAAVVLEPLHTSPLLDSSRLVYGRGLLNGRAAPAPDCADAGILVVAGRDRESCEPVLVCVIPNAAGAEVRPLRCIDSTRSLSEFTFQDTRCELMLSGAPALAAIVWLRRAWSITTAFEQLGMAERALEMAVAYAHQRRTFGRAIGTYQAIKHKLADVFVSIQLARAHAYYAAWALRGDEACLRTAAAAARVAGTEASMLAAQENIQTHGGIGYTWEADCHLFYKRARFYAGLLGSQPYWRSELAASLQNPRGDGDSVAQPSPICEEAA